MGGRKFIKEDAENLSKAMWQLDKDGVIEFYDAVMEHIPGVEQVRLHELSLLILDLHCSPDGRECHASSMNLPLRS